MITTRSTSPAAAVFAHETFHAPVVPAGVTLETPPIDTLAPVGASLATLLSTPAPTLAPPVIALPSATASSPGVVTGMRAAVTALASARSTVTAAELREIASDPVAQLAFANQLYALQHTNALAARRVFGALSSLVEQMSAAEREAIGPVFIARLVESTSFDGAPLQARALVEAFAGASITDAQWQQLVHASRPDPFNSRSSDSTGVGSAGAPDPEGFMRMFLTPRNSSDGNTDPTGLGDVPPPSPGISILLLVIAVIVRPFR